jgi:predicted neuraminidase
MKCILITTLFGLAALRLSAAELRLGLIGLDTSHVTAFTELLNNPQNKEHVPGARVIAAYKGGSPDIPSSIQHVEEYTKTLREKYGVRIYDTIEEVCREVDGVLIESVDGRPHLAQARAVIAAGKPLYIDKPVGGSLRETLEIYRLAKSAGVPIFSSSSLRFARTTQSVRAGSIGRVQRAETSSPAHLEDHHPELFWYGVHGCESLYTVMGMGCQSVIRRQTTDGKIEVEGRWKDGRVGIFREDLKYAGQAKGEKGDAPIGSFDGYAPLVVEIVKFFRTREAPVVPAETIELFAFMQAADESKHRNGQSVTLAEVMERAQAKEPVLRVERVFGPEIKTGPYKHPARFDELANGDLYLVYYGGEGEYANRTAVFGSRLKKGGRTWSKPVLVAQDPFRSLGNAVIWQAPDGVVWLFYVVRYGDTWSTSRVQAKISRDQAATWSDAFPLVEQEGMMVCNRPILLHTGDYLLPIYHETGHDPEFTGFDSTSLFLRYEQPKKQWKQTGPIRARNGSIQAAAVELTNDVLVAYTRRCGGYGPVTNGWIIRAESRDGGWTWSEGLDSKFPNPNAAIDFIKLHSGRLLLVYNDNMNDRTPLTVALSSDQDRSYAHRRTVAVGPYDYAYPLAVQSRDGKIHLIFTSHERTIINHAVLDEEWIMGGGPEKSWLK